MDSSNASARRDFARWCRDADLDALGAFFDRVAPRLLRVAMHVARDPSEAEDLVQSAFLTLIERRESLDPNEDGVAWLAVVLRRRAIDQMRRAGARATTDELDLDAILATVEDAAGPAERRELHAEVLRAIDRLEEPYRQPVLMRLRHGARPAEIAHLLDRSPSAVAVQLHRGMKELRRLLPTSFAVSLASALPGPSLRGLEGIRPLLLERGAVHAAASKAASTSVLFGSLSLMGIKITAGALALIALVLLVASRESTRSAPPSEPSNVARDEVPRVARRSAVELEPTALHGGRTGVGASVTDDSALFSGVIIDGTSGSPIAGASVELFAPQRMTPTDAAHEFPALFRHDAAGRVVSCMPSRLEPHPAPDAAMRTPGTRRDAEGKPLREVLPTWPALEGSEADARFEDRPVSVLGLPSPDESALAQGRSDAAGEFEVAAPRRSGSGRCLLHVEAPGYASRTLSVSPSERAAIDLHRAGRVAGVVLGPDLQPVSMRFGLVGLRGSDAVRPELGDLHSARQLPGGLTAIEVVSDESGHFEAAIGAASVRVVSLDPGWRIRGHDLEVDGKEGGVFLQRSAAFRFVDAGDGESIERVTLRARERRSGYVRLSGTYRTTDGLFGVPESIGFPQAMERSTVELTAWSPGYAPTTITLPDVLPGEPIEVRLIPGSVAGASGRIRRGSAAVEGALVELVATSRLEWFRDEQHVLDATRTDISGRFRVAGPSGPAALRVETPDGPYVDVITLPLESTLEIDLDSLGAIQVSVHTSTGEPVDDHVVAIQCFGTGFTERAYTDEKGTARFERISPNRYTVFSPASTTRGSFRADYQEQVTLEHGRDEHVSFVVPDPSMPRFLRIDAAENTYAGWRARTEWSDWVDVEANGSVPIDLATEAWKMRIASPDGRRWRFAIPSTALDGHVVKLGRGSGTMSGILTDEERSPLGGIAVIVRSSGADPTLRTENVAITDPDGGFRISGLPPAKLTIELREDPEAIGSNSSSRIDGTRFEWTGSVEAETWVELSLPRVTEQLAIEGTVLDAMGTPYEYGRVRVMAKAAEGPLVCRPPKGSSTLPLDGNGRFQGTVPRTSSIDVAVFSAGDRTAIHQETIDVPASGPLAPIEIRLP
ncbi:MAG: sigma-70 family RNA polymerase sigma factor [Planctomycetota bacterium]